MTLFSKTEIDVLRESVRKATLVPVDDPLQPVDDTFASQGVENRRDQVKLGIRIWTALGKFIRGQCNKGRIIDTLCFGSFAKASTIGVTGPDCENFYIYCPGPNSAYTVQENRDNVADLSQQILDERLIQLNFNSIAAVAHCTPESVRSLINTVKADVADFVLVRGNMLNINFMVGSLTFSPTGSVEFKSAAALDAVSSFSSMMPSEKRSRYGADTERELKTNGDTITIGSRSTNQIASCESKRKLGASVFANTSRRGFAKDVSASADQQIEDYGHLTQFLQDQIVNSKRTHHTRTKGSHRSVANTNNALIEQAAQSKGDQKAIDDLVNASKAGADCTKVQKDWQTMNTTHIHKPQYTMPGMTHLRHKTVDQGARTPLVQSTKCMPETVDINYDFSKEGISPDRQLYRHSNPALNNIIRKSLNRKNVSYAFHTGYPLMMNAQGPYAVYSHMKRQGEQAYQGERKTRKAAYQRFEDDLRNLQDERENQRDQFFGNIKEEQKLVQAQRAYQYQTNKANQEYILRQIAQDKETKRQLRAEEVAYKKPHFGPEETADVIEDLIYEDRLKKHTMKSNLTAQMQHNKEAWETNAASQKQCDRENLDRFIEEQNAEMQAQRDKIMNDKRKLKKAWEKQAAMRNDNEARDNLFK